MGDYGQVPISSADYVGVSAGNIESMAIDGENVEVIVYGDYYTQGKMFDPVVGELWSANAVSGALWNPTYSELPDWLIKQAQLKLGYAYLYEGYFTQPNSQPFKPEGVTRPGEVLGYDVYSVTGMSPYKSEGTVSVSNGSLFKGDDTPSVAWAVCNTYRAVGQEIYNYAFVSYPKLDDEGHKNKAIEVIRGAQWDLDSSPVIGFLTGNITEDYTGDNSPVVQVAATRTDFSQYLDRANKDMINLPYSAESAINRIDFLTLVWELMYAYGEPVMTEQEQYMLLEAYGRKLPWDLNQYQLDAVRNLLCRGIIDTEILDWNWNASITFDDACDILMRVKDKESRLTFKQFQLTTDLSLLQKGYYPQDVGVLETSVVDMEPTDVKAVDAVYYDFYFKRNDNRVLFVADGQDYGTVPHVAGEKDGVTTHVPGSIYCGVDDYGYYHFKIPITYFADGKSEIYLNSRNSANDNPGQYHVAVGSNPGGIYTLDGNSYEGQRVSGFDSSLYDDPANIDADRRTKALQEQSNFTKSRTNSLPYTEWTVTVPRTCFYKWDDLAATWGKQLPEEEWVYHGRVFTYNVETRPSDQKGSIADVFSANDGSFKIDDASLPNELRSKSITGQIKYEYPSPYATLIVTCEDGLTAAEVKLALGYDETRLTKDNRDASQISSVQGYVQRDNAVLISVDYLTMKGFIRSFTELASGAYKAIVSPVGSHTVSVYIDTKTSTVYYGSQCFFFPEDRALVYTGVSGQKYIDATIITGKVNAVIAKPFSELGLVDMSAEFTNYVSTKTLNYYDKPGTYNASVSIAEYGEDSFVVTSFPCIASNWVSFYDMRTQEAGVFFFWATPAEGDNSEDNLRAFKERFHVAPASSVGCTYFPVNPGGRELASKVFADWQAEDKTQNVITSKSGTVLFKVGTDMSYTRSAEYLSPVTCVNGEYRHVALNMYKGSPVYLFGTEQSKSAGLTKLDAQSYSGSWADAGRIDVSDVAYVPTGIVATLADDVLTVEQSARLIDSNRSSNVFMFLGTQFVDKLYASNASGNAFILHEHVDSNGQHFYYIQAQGIVWQPASDATRTQTLPKVIAGGTNKITDWLKWLKEAKLSDAEDIITVCIIAVLQWLPRIFMFLFIVLMALSMIHDVKPWQQFCDSVVDPYKVITAGRQTVHTIDLKRTVIYSLIALCLFGLFQNGLILDIIGWCARAVTGILNR